LGRNPPYTLEAMREDRTIGTVNVVAVVGVAALSGVCIAAAVTWLVWSQRWSHWFPEAPFALMVVAYTIISVLGLGKRDANVWRFAAVFFVGLVVMLVAGMTISEVIHCSFDRQGCFNL
jgi:hypothetical protein